MTNWVLGPFFHWWYGFLEASVNKIEHAITGAEDYNSPRDMSLATSSDGFNQTANRKRPLRMLLMKLALNQLVLTPPFLLFTISYIQYFLSLDISKTVQGIKRTYAAALFTNWKVCNCFPCLLLQYITYFCEWNPVLFLWIYLQLERNLLFFVGMDSGAGYQLSTCSSKLPRPFRKHC